MLTTRKTILTGWVVILSLAVSLFASEESAVIKDYKNRIAKYVELHEKVKNSLDSVEESANAAILAKQKQQFAIALRESRQGVVQGNIEKHGSNVELRSVLEPLILKYGVDVVFAGHEHFYERLKPQKGVQYFIVGSSAKLREGNIGKTALTAKGFDQDNVFLVAEIVGDEMRFQTIRRTGQVVDSGSFRRAEKSRRVAGP